jgi:pyruvate dehydrogenase (quinone)/pyruvate decarboxylase
MNERALDAESAKVLPRREFLRLSTATGCAAMALTGAVSAVAQTAPALAGAGNSSPAEDPSLSNARLTAVISQPSPDATTADILVETLVTWGVTFVFGVVGDGINPLIEALRRRQDRIRYIGVRHEEAAAFMASGFAKHTGKLGVCLGTTGPGAVHLLNGLYDAHYDGAPVLAITGTTFHDLGGVRFMQSVDTKALMQDVACFNLEISGPAHALIVANRACRAALGERGVAHITIAKDIQAQTLSSDKPSMENHGARTSNAWMPLADTPSEAQLRVAADILNRGTRIAILAGQGALRARGEVLAVAEKLGAPVSKALLGRAVIPDDSPYSLGGIGHLGTQASQWAMHHCDTVLILGSTMPWIDSYPAPGSARGVQIDLKADRIGLRFPVDVGLVGDVKQTLAAMLPMLMQKRDRTFLTDAQSQMRDWNALLQRVESTERAPLRPQMVIRALSDALADDAVISLDCGANTHFAARHIQLRAGQSFTGTGMLATMGPGLSFAIAAQLAWPKRQSVCVVGDGGFAQLMAELTTAVQHQLPVKIIVMKNNSLAEVKFEQRELGNPEYGCDLSPIDFVAFARACGAEGFRCTKSSEVRSAIANTLHSPQVALLEAVVDANEPPTKPEQLKA